MITTVLPTTLAIIENHGPPRSGAATATRNGETKEIEIEIAGTTNVIGPHHGTTTSRTTAGETVMRTNTGLQGERWTGTTTTGATGAIRCGVESNTSILLVGISPTIAIATGRIEGTRPKEITGKAMIAGVKRHEDPMPIRPTVVHRTRPMPLFGNPIDAHPIHPSSNESPLKETHPIMQGIMDMEKIEVGTIAGWATRTIPTPIEATRWFTDHPRATISAIPITCNGLLGISANSRRRQRCLSSDDPTIGTDTREKLS